MFSEAKNQFSKADRAALYEYNETKKTCGTAQIRPNLQISYELLGVQDCKYGALILIAGLSMQLTMW
jgi:hypothetical protein